MIVVELSQMQYCQFQVMVKSGEAVGLEVVVNSGDHDEITVNLNEARKPIHDDRLVIVLSCHSRNIANGIVYFKLQWINCLVFYDQPVNKN